MKNIQNDFKNIFIFIGLCSLIDIVINNQINLESLLTVMFIFSMSISILSILAIMIFQDAKIDNLYKYLTIGSSIINIYYLNFIVNINSGLVTNLYENKFSKGFFILSVIEPLIIFFSITFRKKNINLKKLIVIESVIFFFLIFIVNNVQFISDGFNHLKVKIIFLVLSIILYTFVINKFHKNKCILSEDNYKKINFSFACKMFSIIVVCVYLFHRNILIFALYPTIKTLGDYYLIKVIMKEIVINTANNFHSKLNQKSKLLEDTVNKLENSQIMLKSALSKNKVLLQAFPDGVILVNDDIVTYVNRETLSILDLGCEEEIVGKNILSINQLKKANIEKKMKESELYKYLKHEKVITLENNNEKKNIELRVNKLDFFQDDSYILILRDITEENKLMEMQKLLDEKKHDEQVKTDILANISHEFKTPVNVIYAAVQMQELEKDRGNYNEINKYNKTIKQNCYRLIRLINNFIDATKYKDKDITIPFTPFNIVNLVEETSLSVLSYVESKHISLVFDTNEEFIAINGNKQLMERVILNILSNAIKYNKENGFINVNVYGEKEKVQIIISDSGIGIPEDKIKMIFNRFERIDKSFSRNNEGSGLGLNIVYEIIKKHNGTIKASSKENFGTTIRITLNRIYADEELLENTNEISDINYNLELEMSDIYM